MEVSYCVPSIFKTLDQASDWCSETARNNRCLGGLAGLGVLVGKAIIFPLTTIVDAVKHIAIMVFNILGAGFSRKCRKDLCKQMGLVPSVISIFPISVGVGAVQLCNGLIGLVQDPTARREFGTDGAPKHL